MDTSQAVGASRACNEVHVTTKQEDVPPKAHTRTTGDARLLVRLRPASSAPARSAATARSAARSAARGRSRLAAEEAALLATARRLAAAGQPAAARAAAAAVVRNRAAAGRLDAVAAAAGAVDADVRAAAGMGTAVGVMATATAAVASGAAAVTTANGGAAGVRAKAAAYGREAGRLAAAREAMEEGMDDALAGGDEVDMAADEVLGGVLDELGLEVGGRLGSVSVPATRVGTPAAATLGSPAGERVAMGEDAEEALIRQLAGE
ncbi:hypothetical protein MMPV_002776 [Pyropia vietnamensis]